MKKIVKYENVASDSIGKKTVKSAAFKETVSVEQGKILFESDSKNEKKESDEYLKKLGLLDEDEELEKAMYMYQCYPCLRYNLESYIPIMKRKVIGQDKVLEKLAFVTYYNQYVNFLAEYTENENYKRKSMFLIAPTGCGKSTMLRALEKAFDVPVYRANATAVTSAGYIGDKVETMLLGLIERAGGDVTEAERGILLIDEIDKKITSTTNDRDIAGKAVQQELLKFFEQGTVNVPISRKNPDRTFQFDTSNLTVILAGACVGLDEIRKKRLGSKKTIGFSQEQKEGKPVTEYTSEDLIEYGFIPELIGRIDVIEELEPYTKSTLVDIIYFSDESSMQEHVRVLNSLGVDKIMVDGALWERVAEEILNNKLGIRELNKMMTKLFYPILYEAFQHTGSSGTCVIDVDGRYTLTYDDEDKVYTGKGIELKDFDNIFDET